MSTCRLCRYQDLPHDVGAGDVALAAGLGQRGLEGLGVGGREGGDVVVLATRLHELRDGHTSRRKCGPVATVGVDLPALLADLDRLAQRVLSAADHLGGVVLNLLRHAHLARQFGDDGRLGLPPCGL